MKTKNHVLTAGIILTVLFLILNVLLKTVDLQAIGPENSVIGLGTLNGLWRDAIGSHPEWYDITDYLGYFALAIAGGMAIFGICQLISRKKLSKVDPDLYVLASLYVVTGILYVFYEKVIINYRPVILEEGLEASFPSSHTILSLVILGSAVMQIRSRIGTGWIRAFLMGMCIALMAVIIIGRILSGVHWFTDILGALLIGSALLCFYRCAVNRFRQK